MRFQPEQSVTPKDALLGLPKSLQIKVVLESMKSRLEEIETVVSSLKNKGEERRRLSNRGSRETLAASAKTAKDAQNAKKVLLR
jgi:hypothetical protein